MSTRQNRLTTTNYDSAFVDALQLACGVPIVRCRVDARGYTHIVADGLRPDTARIAEQFLQKLRAADMRDNALATGRPARRRPPPRKPIADAPAPPPKLILLHGHRTTNKKER